MVGRGSRGERLLPAALIGAAVLAGPAPAAARDAVVKAFDGTPIVTHFFPAEGAGPANRAPTVLHGHGWGGSGGTNPNDGTGEGTGGGISVGDLHRAGFNVLTWDARGFGGSGGAASVDGPDFEARDVMALIDFVAQQPEARLDEPGDPRLGMAGSSYGGGIQLVTAALEPRIDAIVPDIAWHSLETSLFKSGALKQGWGLLLGAGGVAGSVLPGVFSPAGTQTGTLDPHITSALVTGAATGGISGSDLDWFRSRGPGELVERIRVPTLLTEGTVDTLFTLQEAIDNFTVLKRNGVPVKMMWHCGGHGVCNVPAGTPGYVERATIAWLKRYVAGDTSVDVGPSFEWVADDGTWRFSEAYPLAARPPLALSGAGGSLLLTPADTVSGTPLAAAPAGNALNLPLPAPAPGLNLVGPPRLELRYSGVAVPQSTFVYAQIVNTQNNLVAGNQATPLPVVLDGQERTLSLPLEPLSLRTGEGSRYTLQLTGGTLLYGTQRSLGTVEFSGVKAELPSGDPVAGGAPLARRRARLRIGRVARRRVVVRSNGIRVRNARVVVRNRRGRVVARSRQFDVVRRRKPRLRWRTRARAGRYRVRVAGRDPQGRRVRAGKRFRLR
jgi:ABC-2 type transport system ATP-binding protein